MKLTTRTGDLQVYQYYMQNVELVLWLGFLLVAASVAFTKRFPIVWLWWTQAGVQHLSLYLPVYAGLALMASILSVLSVYESWMRAPSVPSNEDSLIFTDQIYNIGVVLLHLMPRVAIRLHEILLRKVIHAPLSFLATTDIGVILNRFSQDMSIVDLPLPISLITVVNSLFGYIAQPALISTGSSYMAITIPFTLLAIYSIQNVYLKTSRQLRFLDLENKSPVFSHFIETLDGLATIRAFDWEQKAKDTQHRNLDHSQQSYHMLLRIQCWRTLSWISWSLQLLWSW